MMRTVRLSVAAVLVVAGCAALGVFVLLGIAGFPTPDTGWAYPNDAVYLAGAFGAFTLAWLVSSPPSPLLHRARHVAAVGEVQRYCFPAAHDAQPTSSAEGPAR